MARFSRRSKNRWYFALTVADPDAPTAAELAAATRLDTQLAEINGFTFANSPIQTPVMSDAFTPQVPGEDTAEDSNLVFWEDRVSNPIKVALEKGLDGFVISFPVGLVGATPAAGDLCEVWPATIGSNARRYTVANEGAQYQVSFSITNPPAIDVDLVA